MIKLEMHETLPDHVIESLCKQNVFMDDWDYVLFVDNEYKDHFRIYESQFDRSEDIILAKSYEVRDLLHGCCQNVWYEVKDFFGRPGILGVAYHA